MTADLDLADIARRRAALAESMPVWTPMTLDEHLDHCAATWPDRPYIIFDDEPWSYRRLADRSRELAGALIDGGVLRGAHVGVLMANSPDFFAMTFALARVGACVVPLNYLLAPAELAFVLCQSRCEFVVAEPTILGIDALATLDAVVEWDRAAAADRQRLVLERLLLTESIGDREPLIGARVLDTAAAPYDGHSRSTPDGASHILYTSGSTGFPKGVLIAHDSIRREGYGSALSRAFDDGWRVLCSLPPFHIFGLLQAVMASSFVGGCTVLERTFDPVRQLALIERHRVDDTVCVPAMGQRLIDAAREAGSPAGLRAILCAGNSIPAAVWTDMMSTLGVRELTTGYGMTETCSIAFLVCPDHPFEWLVDTVGQPKMSGVAGIPEFGGRQMICRVVDVDTGHDVEPGRDGELLFCGPTVTRGYWDNDIENERSFDGSFLRSGDVGHIRGDGCLVLTGRTKEMFKSGGENVTPKEVEVVLETHASVRQAIVVGVPDPKWGEVGCAWIVFRPNADRDEEALIQHCRERLAKYKVPRAIYAIEESDLPLTGLGKLHRKELVARAKDRRAVEGRAS